MSGEDDFQRWIKEVMPKVIESLGSNVEEARYEVSEPSDLFMSTLYHVCVKFKNKNEGQNEELSLVLKRPVQIKLHREMVLIDPQFHNEILFYRNYFKPDENFPRCFYTDEKPPTDSVIALENIIKRGYCPPPSAYDAPLEYILAAIREIGRFHAKGYIMKEQQSDKFFDIVQQLQESRYDVSWDESEKLMYNFSANRAVEYLRNQGYDAVFCDKMDAFLSKTYDTVMVKTAEPKEPLATLCHGDFTLNNILFKTEDDGQLRPMLIDFALSRYSTPVVDLSTFLYLSCSNEVRKDNFFDIIRAYHDTIKKHLLDAGVQNIDKYSYDAFLDDFKRGALFGFIIASFFLTTLMGYDGKETFDKMITGDMSQTDYLIQNKQAGGEKVSKILADMLLQLKDLGCLKHIL